MSAMMSAGSRPAVDRQAEGRFGHERVRAHRLERGTRGIGGELVVTRHDPCFAAMLDAHLRRSEHVAGGVQRNRHAVSRDALAVIERLDRYLAEPGTQHGQRRTRGDVMPAAGARMIGVRVRDDRMLDRPPRIDVEVAGRAIEAFGPYDDQVHEMRRTADERSGTRP
jgi:hypothetical protein